MVILFSYWLIRQRTKSIRFSGYFLSLLLLIFAALYLFSWQSPWYVSRGAEQVQEFAIDTERLGLSRTRIIDGIVFVYTPTEAIFWDDFAADALRWMNQPTRLQLGWFTRKAQVLIAKLESRQESWQPAETVNFDKSQSITALFKNSKIQENGDLSVIYPFPGKENLPAELSFFGFSLPQFLYQIAFPFGDSGWYIDRNYFGWMRLRVRESESNTVVVELAQTIFNARLLSTISWRGLLVAWLPAEGNFLIFSGARYGDLRVLVLGPFKNSQPTQLIHEDK